MATSSWGRLSKSDRAQATAAGKRYGLSRDAVRGRYNRGTYNPLSDSPRERLPRELRQVAGPSGDIDWHAAAERSMISRLSDYYGFSIDRVRYMAENMSDKAAEFIATASESELTKFASIQPDANGNLPPIEQWGLPPGFTLDDVTIEVDGELYNVFWYH